MMSKQAFETGVTVTYMTEEANHTATVVGYAKGWYSVALLDDPDTVFKARAKDLALYEIPEDEEEGNRSMAKQLAAARAHYIKSTSASGKPSMHNGDQLAQLLAGAEPLEVMSLATEVLAQTDEGDTPCVQSKYEHLNPGQQRMNAGNLIRARVKKELITVDEVAELFAKI